MTIDLLIHAIVRQTTILIAQLATSRGVRAPLAQVANQVFLDLVGELERQGVSRKVSADMFGLGLRTYRRRIQRMSESSTERGRSLWEVVLEYVRARQMVRRVEILNRFSGDDEAQVKAVLYDLCESQLVFSSGTGSTTTYRAASEDEFVALQHLRGAEGLDELLLSLVYRDGPLTVDEIADRAKMKRDELEDALARLLAAGRVDRMDREGVPHYQANSLVIPLGASAGWEGAVFDHFKALVTTIICRLRDNRETAALSDRIGGSTYTIDVWPGHPLADKVYGSLGRIREEFSNLREEVEIFNGEHEIPETNTRVVIYAGQCLIGECNGQANHDEQASS
jgi:hypothetical protein